MKAQAFSYRKIGLGDFTIRTVEHGRWFLRHGGEFVLTFTWRSWGIEICRDRSQNWAQFGAATRFVAWRIGRLWFQILLGELGGYVPAHWIPRRNARWCVVTKAMLWPSRILDDVLDAEEVE